MSGARAFARRLAEGGRIATPVAVVVAHPDDESLWAGGLLARGESVRLVHVTDGAPIAMGDAVRAGYRDGLAYAAARGAETDAALETLGYRGVRIRYGIGDQEVIEQVTDLAQRLATDCAEVKAIVAHPYEGGHPDHDAIALAARLATNRIARERGRAPALVEFACYHLADGARRFGAFWPDAGSPEQVRTFGSAERERIGRAIGAHASQAPVIDGWRPEAERWRAAPAYDFAAPPPPGACLYDGFGWPMTGARWRDLAREVIAVWV